MHMLDQLMVHYYIIAIPAVLPKPKNIIISEDSNDQEEPNNSTKMTFRLLGRDTKGRVETRQLLVPTENKIAMKLLQKSEKDRLEKELLKEKTLLYETMTDSDETTQKVAYLGNKDHFINGNINSRAPNQKVIERSSQNWKDTNNNSNANNNIVNGGGKSSVSNVNNPRKEKTEPTLGSGYNLDLDGFLAVASADEIQSARKFNNSVKDIHTGISSSGDKNAKKNISANYKL
jgi:hypothetical protein